MQEQPRTELVKEDEELLRIKNLLVAKNGELNISGFRLAYATRFGNQYTCPKAKKKCKKLSSCLQLHFKQICSLVRIGTHFFLKFCEGTSEGAEDSSTKHPVSALAAEGTTSRVAENKAANASAHNINTTGNPMKSEMAGTPDPALEEDLLKIQELLLAENGKIDTSQFRDVYAKRYKKKYNCPSTKNKCSKLSSCLENHFSRICSVVKIGNSFFLKVGGVTSKVVEDSAPPHGTESSAGAPLRKSQNEKKNSVNELFGNSMGEATIGKPVASRTVGSSQTNGMMMGSPVATRIDGHPVAHGVVGKPIPSGMVGSSQTSGMMMGSPVATRIGGNPVAHGVVGMPIAGGTVGSSQTNGMMMGSPWAASIGGNPVAHGVVGKPIPSGMVGSSQTSGMMMGSPVATRIDGNPVAHGVVGKPIPSRTVGSSQTSGMMMGRATRIDGNPITAASNGNPVVTETPVMTKGKRKKPSRKPLDPASSKIAFVDLTIDEDFPSLSAQQGNPKKKAAVRQEISIPTKQTNNQVIPVSQSLANSGCDSVKVSSRRAPVFEFELGEVHKGGLPTMADVNNRVNAIRTNMSKSGLAVDMFTLLRKLCEYYGVRSVQDLRCTDKPRGFEKEIHIDAISAYSKVYCKVLCTVHSYCTCSTIATLYDLEKFICEKENKDSFLDLKIGPLQKIPLVYEHFKFPSDMEIKKLSSSDVMQHLWKYCGKHARGKKVEMEKFLEYLAEKGGFASPYEMGLKINSIALAIQVVKKVKFGDFERMKKAEQDLLTNMEQDLEDYIRKIRRGLTGRNTRALPGQPENITQQIAGMYIEDAIMAIFKHANDCTKSLQRNILRLPGVLTAAQRIVETMTFFRSRPVWSKFFHVIVATGIYRTLGLDDEALLTALGFKDALKKMTEERMAEMLPDSALIGHGKGPKRKTRIFKEAQVKEKLRGWLEKCSKPVDLTSLSNVERGVAQSLDLEAIGFESIRQETFLGFLIRNIEFHKYLGSSIMVKSSTLNKTDEGNVLRNNVEEFILQCGQGKDKSDILCSIKKQFPDRRSQEIDIETLIADYNNDVQTQPSCPIKYLYALMCGSELSNNITTNGASSNDQGNTGCLGYFSHDDVMICLEAAPLLEDLATWSNWKMVFEPSFGDLKAFLRKQDKVHAVEISKNVFLKVDLDCTTEDLKIALDAQNARETIGCLLSIICANGGLCETPLLHLANIVKSSLATKLDVQISSDYNSQCLERFVLQCLMLLPVEFCSTIANKVFLSPLTDILGDGQDTESVPARILAVCKSSSERSYLHSLGAVLAIQEWTTDFREYCFVRHECVSKNEKSTEIREKNYPSVKEKSESQTANAEASTTDKILNAEPIDDSLNLDDVKDSCPDDRTDSDDNESIMSDIDANDTVLGEIESRLQHCKELINEIRRDEFGKGEVLGEKEAILLQRNNERLCRSLDRLSKELYTKDTHFVLELIQNADDNKYDESLFADDSEEKPSVTFIVDKSHVIVLNNECGFQDKDIRAICDVGKSTKGAHRKGYIGQKGIGFKSVFKITDCPEIHSNGFHICFDASKDSMGYILPDWREIGGFDDLTEYTPPQLDIPLNWRTQINLPLKQNMIGSKNTSARFQDIHPTLLLFLNRLNTIIVDNRINKKCLVMKKRARGDSIVELTQNGIPSLWFVITTEIDMHARGERETTDVSLAFPLDDASASDQKTKTLPMQSVFAFLPLRSYGFKFLIQADFEVPSSREDINRDSAWNQSILQEIPRLVVEAFFKFRDGKSADIMSDPLYAATRLFHFLPLESEILGVFKPIARKILQLLQKECCIPVITEEHVRGSTEGRNGTSWMIPSQVILGDSILKKIITPSQLQRYLNLNYMCTVMQENVSSALLNALGVQSENLDHLLEISRSHLKVITEESGQAQATVQWIGKWFLCVSEYLERNCDSSQESRQKIRNASVFPLSNGELVNLIDKALFFPFAKKSSKSKHAQESISKLEGDLNTLDEDIFVGLDEIEKLKVTRLLSDLGVKNISPKLVIDNHIIPAFKSGKWKEHLLYSYLIYIKEQFSADQSTVDIEDLKTCVVLKTSNGFVNPSQQKVYFTKKFGNEIDLKQMFSSFNWTLIDSMYLQNSTSSDVKSWEKFFTKLGVSHFPKMQRKIFRLDQSELVDCPWFHLAQKWPTTEDGVYEIEDLVCEEIDSILQSNDSNQLSSLALLLDKRWKSNFSHIQKEVAPVRDSKGNHIATTNCSLLIKLKTMRWLPGVTAFSQPKKVELFAPKDLYLPLQNIKAVFSDFCSYFVENLQEQSFIEAIGIQHRATIEDVFSQLDVWSRNTDFTTSLSHMTKVYHFIQSHSSDVDPTEFDKRIIFVPKEIGRQTHEDTENVRGSFYMKNEVCLYDHSTISVRYSNLFPNRRHLLFQFYPKDILEFFETTVKIDNSPNVREYVNMACVLADDTQLPDTKRVEDLMTVFATLGEKCLLQNDVVVQSDYNVSLLVDDLRNHLDSTMANFVLSNIQDEQIFPALSGRFVSLKERPLLPDSEHETEIFKESENVHFLDLPSYLKNWLKGERLPRDGGSKINIRKLIKGVVAFFAICKIELLSSVACPSEIIPESSEIGCVKWQKELSILLPYIQRYLLTKERSLYDNLVKQDIKQRLQEIKFFTVNSLTALHKIKDNDNVLVKKRRKVALEELETSTYFHISRDFLNEQDDIIAEFLKLFIKNNRELEDKMSDLLLVLSSEKDPIKKERHLNKRGIKKLPENETKWMIPDPIELRPVKKIQTAQSQEGLKDGGGSVTCWPPPRPSGDGSMIKPKPQSGNQQKELTQWPVPAPPESMTSGVDSTVAFSPIEKMRRENMQDDLLKRQTSHSGAKEQGETSQNIATKNTGVTLSDFASQPSVTPDARIVDPNKATSALKRTPSTIHIPPAQQTPSVPPKIPPDVQPLPVAQQAATQAQNTPLQVQQAPSDAQLPPHDSQQPVPAAVPSSSQSQAGASVIKQTQYQHLLGHATFSNSLLTAQETPPTLQCAYENVEHGEIDVKLQNVCMNLNNDSPESDIVGRIGEEIVYKELQKMFVSHDNVKVIWLNENGESRSPFDIAIESDLGDNVKDYRYIEVKATKALNDKPFEISSHELKFAFQHAERFDIYRVSGINANLENVSIKRLVGLPKYMDAKIVKVFIVL